jgi:hypothetical protein
MLYISQVAATGKNCGSGAKGLGKKIDILLRQNDFVCVRDNSYLLR